MYPLMDPFFYEAVADHQHGLRESARDARAPAVAGTPAAAPAPPGGRALRCARERRPATAPCLSRLPGQAG